MTGPQLREPELVALTSVAIGLSHAAAARRLGISVRTLRRCIADAAVQLEAVSTPHAVGLAMLSGQLGPEAVRARYLPPWPQAGGLRRSTPESRRRYLTARLAGASRAEAVDLSRLHWASAIRIDEEMSIGGDR